MCVKVKFLCVILAWIINNLMLMIFVFFRLYEATIEEILDDGACTVTFNDYGNTDVTQVCVCVCVCVCMHV